MSSEDNIFPKYSLDLSGKFLFMRHGQSLYNKVPDESRKYDPQLIDAYLSEDGINQSKSRQEELNKLDIEKVYVSPYNRALETMTYALKNHPNIQNIVAIVHPKISELVWTVHDFILDIKQKKQEFNMNSLVKVDWSYFDEYNKNTIYDENFFYFENMNLLDEKIKEAEYLKLKNLYHKGKLKEFKDEIGRFIKENKKDYIKYESFKHSYERFEEFKNYIKKEFKETINNKNKKILCISHSGFIMTASSPSPFLKDERDEKKDKLYHPGFCEIISLSI